MSFGMIMVLEPVYKTIWRHWSHIYPLIALPLAMPKWWHHMIVASNRLKWFCGIYLFAEIWSLIGNEDGILLKDKWEHHKIAPCWSQRLHSQTVFVEQ
jgi:hypothetical protein